MPDPADTNAAIWKSEEAVSQWVANEDAREQRRAEVRRLMASLLPFADDEEFTFVDLGAGTGAAARAVLDRFPHSSAILADYSPQMMEEGRRQLADYQGRYRYVELDLASGAWPVEIPVGTQAMISSLCVHHLTDERKQGLFAEIMTRLAPGGWYLNFDPVSSDDPLVAAAWQRADDRQDPEAEHQRHHRSADEQHRYENHVRYIIPLAPQLEFLRAAGFEAIDLYWKQLDYVVYGGRRPV